MPDDISFTRGFVFERSRIYVTAVVDDLNEHGVVHSLMLRWADGKWGHWLIEAGIVSHCVCSIPNGRLVFALSEDGEIQVADGTNVRWESLASLRTRPGLGNLISIRLIGNSVYVVGMQRQVYRRGLAGGGWMHADRGCVVPPGSLEIASFASICGVSEENIYAVGFYGQLWHWNGTQWTKLDSPTNVKLEAVCCVNQETTYIAGARGLVFKGKESVWNQVMNTSCELTFWGIAEFQGEVYLSTDQGVICKIKDDEVVLVETGLEPISTFDLHASDGILLSTGRKDLVFFDGSEWQRLPYQR